jgi:N-methylhydantoinase B
MSVATTNLADRVTNPVQVAFSMIQDGLGLAECGPILPASIGVISGKDPRRNNEDFVNQIFLLFTGGAGSAWNDSWVTIAHAGNGGMCYIDSVELDELHFPILVKGRWVVTDTEGAGRTTGAPSGYCEFGPIGDKPLDVGWVADGAINAASGTLGGSDGAPIQNYCRKVGGEMETLPPCAMITLQPGETVVSYSAGGGGYGPPWERPSRKVLEDVTEGLVSPDKAKETYGVVIDSEGRMDEDATAIRRKDLSGVARVRED